jgi:hypothetical protein
MTDQIQELFQAGVLQRTSFPPESRYHGVALAQITRPDGTTLTYLRRRFVPPVEAHSLIREHLVSEGDRLDNIAAAELGDPEQFWRLCDANAVIRPTELTDVVGRRIRVTLPAGIPAIGGSSFA